MNLVFWEKIQEISKLYGTTPEYLKVSINVVKFKKDGYEVFLTEHPPNGVIIISYWKNGLRHRPVANGPAYEEFGSDGKSTGKAFYEEGQTMREPEFPNET
jgi:hypothetical protein